MLTRIEIEAVRQRHPIDEVLQQLGVDMAAGQIRLSDILISCPMPDHDDSTPSCVIHLETNRLHCFGCGFDGDVFDVTGRMTGLRSFPDIVGYLEGHVSQSPQVIRPTVQFSGPPEFGVSADEIRQINAAAWQFLTRPDRVERAHTYLETRGIDRDGWCGALANARVGHTPLTSDGLVNHLSALGRSREELIVSGWAVDAGNRMLDRFRHRVLFPAFDEDHRVIGVYGRDVTGAALHKYVNTRTNAVFRKGSTLYMPTTSVGPSPTVVLTEGPIDALAVAQHAGPDLLVAALAGSSLTENQSAHIASLQPREVVVLPDGDEAGRRAAIAWDRQLMDFGLRTRRLELLPAGEDPASWLKVVGPTRAAEVVTLIRGASPRCVTNRRPIVEQALSIGSPQF